MSAQKIAEETAARPLLDRHFDRDELSAILGTDDEIAHSLARRATWAPLADLLSRPGKGVRSRLVEHAFAIAHEASPCTCASLPPQLPQVVELLHAGSLIVDDVEDNAKTRRGAPALHEIFGAPIAINAGNFLYFLPIVLVSQMQLGESIALAMHRRIARSLLRCHHGQGLDLALKVSELAPAEVQPAVELTTSLKTGALMELACALGAMAAHASPAVERALSTFGREAGIGLQMLDDVSGFLAPSRRNKGIEDLVANRPTWAWVFAEASVDESVFRGFQRSARTIAKSHLRAESLLVAMKPALEGAREKCRARIDGAVETLRAEVGSAVALEPLVRDIRALEHGYV
jgi:geranylgeranyl pyrophosphate synthase